MRNLIVFSLLFVSLCNTAPAFAQDAEPDRFWATNLGRTVLSRSDLIVTGTLAQSTRSFGTLTQRDLVVSRVLWGATLSRTITIVYENRRDLEDGTIDVLLALKSTGTGATSFRLAARRELDDARSKTDAIAHYCEIESSNAPRQERLEELRDLLVRQLRTGGPAARFASVELIYYVLNHPELLDHQDYLTLREIRRSASRPVQADIDLALRGLIAVSLKPDAQVEVLVSDNESARVRAISRLNGYLADVPEAFGQRDVDRCLLLVLDASDRVDDLMLAHQRRIQAIVDARVAEAESARLASDWLRQELGRRSERSAAGEASGEPFALPNPPPGTSE